jgi:hypothetical protein
MPSSCSELFYCSRARGPPRGQFHPSKTRRSEVGSEQRKAAVHDDRGGLSRLSSVRRLREKAALPSNSETRSARVRGSERRGCPPCLCDGYPNRFARPLRDEGAGLPSDCGRDRAQEDFGAGALRRMDSGTAGGKHPGIGTRRSELNIRGASGPHNFVGRQPLRERHASHPSGGQGSIGEGRSSRGRLKLDTKRAHHESDAVSITRRGHPCPRKVASLALLPGETARAPAPSFVVMAKKQEPESSSFLASMKPASWDECSRAACAARCHLSLVPWLGRPTSPALASSHSSMPNLMRSVNCNTGRSKLSKETRQTNGRSPNSPLFATVVDQLGPIAAA